MLKQVAYGGTLYSKLEPIKEKGLYEKSIKFKFDAKKKASTIELKIDAFLVYTEFPSKSISLDVLKSQSKYELTIVNGVTAVELYEVVKHSIECLKAFQFASEQQKKTYLKDIPNDSFDSVKDTLNQMAQQFSKQFP
ncbi:MAG TPA: hypothetical protein PKM63_21350 [Panacibacter sp.]|nr:hypothetical protein [Panacibacter sp.]HNP46858.1 hypothetical protein [Panacibacter sp.]